MRTIPVSYLAFAVVLGLAGAARADDSPRALIEKAIKALGGEERPGLSLAIHTRIKGIVFVPGAGAGGAGITLTGESREQSGAHYLELTIDVGGQKLTMRRAYRDGKGWQDMNGAISDLSADDLADSKRSEYIDRVSELRPLLKDKAFTLEALGKSDVEGVEVLGVKVSSSGNPDVKLYFERKTGYLKQLEYRAKMKGQDKEQTRRIVLDDVRAIEPAADEERTLKAADIGTDGPALLKFLRARVLSDADREKVKALIRQLGDDSFEVREKATGDLIQLGEVALPELRLAAKSADAEVVRRARQCLGKIVEVKGLVPAALRLVALKHPDGAAEVLLALAPSVTDEETTRELRGALAAIALRDGKPDQLIVKALDDKDPARRSTAAAALGKDGGAFEKVPNRRLFLRGAKRAMKETFYQDGEKELVLEVTEVQIYNRFDDKVFEKPK